MEAKAFLRQAKVGPRKAQLVADLIRGEEVEKALGILTYTPKKASPMIKKLLESAIANMKDLFKIENDLYVKSIWVTEGPSQKRMLPRAKGSGDRIVKRSSHITIVVANKEQ